MIFIHEQEKVLIKVGYYVEVLGYDGKKRIWEVVDDHFFEEGKEYDEIGIWRFDYNLFDKDEEGLTREVLSEYPYLITLTDLWPGYWKNKSERINMNAYKDNGKSVGIVNG